MLKIFFKRCLTVPKNPGDTFLNPEGDTIDKIILHLLSQKRPKGCLQDSKTVFF